MISQIMKLNKDMYIIAIPRNQNFLDFYLMNNKDNGG